MTLKTAAIPPSPTKRGNEYGLLEDGECENNPQDPPSGDYVSGNFDFIVSSTWYYYRPFPPLSKADKERALKYMKKCEQKEKNGHIFQNFEEKLKHHIKHRKKYQGFNYTFIEYVLLEVAFRNVEREDPSYNPIVIAADWVLLWWIRAECLWLHQASPRFFAGFYIDMINDSLVRSCHGRCMEKYLMPDQRRRTPSVRKL